MYRGLLTSYFFPQAVISREEFGALGPDDNCWPQMAGMVPTVDDEVENAFPIWLALPFYASFAFRFLWFV